jgi:hypothetical protein
MCRCGPVRIRSGAAGGGGGMTAGDGEHPRGRFVRRLNELFAVADLTNDRVATLVDELVRDRRVSGIRGEDYKGYRGINARRLGEWRRAKEPAVPQRWVHLAAVLTVLVERARRKVGERAELYDMAAWRRLYDEAANSKRPTDAAQPAVPEAPSPHQADGALAPIKLDLEPPSRSGMAEVAPPALDGRRLGVGSARRLPATWRVPFPVDPEFVGRDDEITALGNSLTTGSRAVVTQTISGLGGVGKTQLAAHVAHAVADEFDVIWWIEAEHRSTMEASFRALGKALEFGNELSSTDVLAKLSALDRSVNWLLIYDNVESPSSLQGMLPTRGSGVVLITTRYHDWPAWASILNLGPLSTEAAVSLLAKDMAGGKEAAERIAEMFGCLPLALRQAAAQVRSGISLAKYEEVLRSRLVDALRSPVSLPDYSNSVVDVVELARAAAADAEPMSSRLLVLLALLDADRVEDWLLQALPEDDPLADPLVLVRALAALKRFSLVTEVQGDTRAYAMHRLVQEVVRHSSETDLSATANLALQTLANAIRSAHRQDRDQYLLRAAAHVRSFLEVAERYRARETVNLLALLASQARVGFSAESTATWAARVALGIVEQSEDFSQAELVGALLLVHEAEKNPMRHRRARADTTAIRRALAVRRGEDPHGFATAMIQLELARTLARQRYWWVEQDFDEDDLTEAASLAEASISIMRDDGDRKALASAHLLHAGVIGHLHLVEDAVAESYTAVSLAEAGGELWSGRAPVAYALLKFGRLDDARRVIQPMFERLCDGSDQGIERRMGADTILRVYSTAVYEQRDWREYIRYAELKRREPDKLPRIGKRPDDITEYYSLSSLRLGYVGLESSDTVAELDEQLEMTACRYILGSLSMAQEESSLGVPKIEGIVRHLETFEGRSLPAGVDWLYGLKSLADRHDLKARIARVERRFRERDVKNRKRMREQRPGFPSSGSDNNLVAYALMREASELAEFDWKSAVSTFKRVRSMIDDNSASIPRSELARACLNMVSEARPESVAFLDEATETLTSEAGYDGQHSTGFQCDVPSLLDRAAHLYVNVAGNFTAAINLEFAAAALEEKVHGRVFPSVSMHLFNAGYLARKGGPKVAVSVNAVALLEEALDIASICFGEENPRWAGRAMELSAAIGDEDPGRARSLLKRAERILTKFYGAHHSAVGEAKVALAVLAAPN